MLGVNLDRHPAPLLVWVLWNSPRSPGAQQCLRQHQTQFGTALRAVCRKGLV